MSIFSLMELGYLRLTVFERLGVDAASLGLVDVEGATVFSNWAPWFEGWVQQLPKLGTLSTVRTGSGVGTEDDIGVLLGTYMGSMLFNKSRLHDLSFIAATLPQLAGSILQWFIQLPIYSLSPLAPPQVFHPDAAMYLGGGGRLLFSLERYPHESAFGVMTAGYFVGFCIGDLLLGLLHYRDQVNPLSGWVHHLAYMALTYQMARDQDLSLGAICGGPFEFSTIFLSIGYVFPNLRSDFWFPLSFFTVRIVYHFLIWHEMSFNYVAPKGCAALFGVSFLLHVFWLQKYFRGRRRRARRDREVKKINQALTEKKADKEENQSQNSGISTARISNVGRGHDRSSRTIQLRAQ
ncbi:hypothetical protein EDD11_000676 [Mortierella claussenii]|nr:hypothetical protein EDD11_000656 [Mortierella claussenii]KAI1315548.1 hypothetical protein EDD11_000676 [Mortierella claussenii]